MAFGVQIFPNIGFGKRDEVVSIPYLTRVSQAPVIKDKKELEGKHLGFLLNFQRRRENC